MTRIHRPETIAITTDVLIIGGGLAGCMAAIKASESASSVTIAEKADTRTSGCAGSGIDHIWAHIPPVHDKMGYRLEDLMDSHSRGIANGFINRELLRLVAGESYHRVLDLESFGVRIRYADSPVPGNFRIVYQFHDKPSAFNFDGRRIKNTLTKEARKRGVRIVNRVTVTELLTSADGHIAGAVGVGTRDGKLYVFQARAVVLSTGRVNRLSRSVSGVWGNHRIPVNETGDGRAMAFRAGLPIINMEFLSPSHFSIGNFELNLGSPRNTTQPAGSVVEGDGTIIVPRTYFYDWINWTEGKGPPIPDSANAKKTETHGRPDYFQLHHEGRGPFYLDLTGGSEEEIEWIKWSISHEGKGYLFLDYLENQEHFDFRRDKLEWLPNCREMAGTAASGLVVNGELETDLKGLFAAGDEVGGVPWSASPGAFTMGWRAGEMAAMEAKRLKAAPEGGNETVASVESRFTGLYGDPEGRGSGQSWLEVELAIKNIVDHYAGNVRSRPMLERGIERLKTLRTQVNLTAETAHTAGRCFEILSLLDNADMVMRASLERKESRRRPFGFFRADFPDENNDEFFAFLGIKQDKGDISFIKKKIIP